MLADCKQRVELCNYYNSIARLTLAIKDVNSRSIQASRLQTASGVLLIL